MGCVRDLRALSTNLHKSLKSGAPSLRYSNARENVISVEAILADGSIGYFGPAA
jgi:hypothetical protein